MKIPLISNLRKFFRKARAGREFIFPHTPFSSRPARPVRRSFGEGGAKFLQSPARPASWRGGQNQSGFCSK